MVTLVPVPCRSNEELYAPILKRVPTEEKILSGFMGVFLPE
jgi:hypothetical protein